MFIDPIKCAFIWDEKKQQTFHELETLEGDPLSTNELVDIGGDRWGHKWPDDITTFTWKFISRSNDIDAYYQRRCFNVAFRTIGFLIPRKYRYIHDQTQKTHFTHEFTHDLGVFNDRTQVLAQAYLYHPRIDLNGVIQWNDNWFFTPFGDNLEAYLVDNVHYTEGEKWADGRLKMLGTQPLLHIGMHEIKHAHGYRHDLNSPESIMYPWAKNGYLINGEVNKSAFIWSDDDILRWEEGYGRRNFAIRHLNRFRARRVRGRFVDDVPYRIAI